MGVCSYDTWTLKEVAEALEQKEKDGRIISVPLFQRSIVWKKEQSKMFIDSLKKGFPIGTLLFSKIVRDNKEVFILIDGLQRSNTIKNYIQNPTQFFSSLDVDDKLLHEIADHLIHENNQENFQTIKTCLIEYIIDNRIETIESGRFANHLLKLLKDRFPQIANLENSEYISDKLAPFIQKYRKNYNDICNAKIPIIIYYGEEKYLPDIFARINNQGTALTKYQIYAASWSTKGKITVQKKEIIDAIIDKYENMLNEGFELQGYNKEDFVKTKRCTIFEYVFGFGKYISNSFKYLFEPDRKVEEINPIGFELLNACFGKNNDEIKNLYQDIRNVDLDTFQECILSTIEFIDDLLKPYIAFIGNKQKKSAKFPIFHAKNQIISIIASTFLEKYDLNNLEIKPSWEKNKKLLEHNIPLHYVFDILSQEWGEGGIGKIYTLINNNKYLQPISKQTWDAMLDNWFIGQLNREETRKVANAKLSDRLFLNCIYTDIFTAKKHLSNEKFDVEHIVPKDYMRKILTKYEWHGQPVSCIANLCYLPQHINRSKKDNTFYQDTKYLDKLSISLGKTSLEKLEKIEEDFSFTQKIDLEWVTSDYNINDYERFAENYSNFLKNRFKVQKEKFYRSMGIENNN